MSTLDTTFDEAGAGSGAVPRDSRELLGRVMGFVAVSVAFAALGAYLGRDLGGATGLALLIGAFAVVLGLNTASASGREQLAIGLLFALGLLIGLAVAPVIADYLEASPVWAPTATPRAEICRPGRVHCSGRFWR